MPIRVKPVHDLGHCLLDLNSIKGICVLLSSTIAYASFSATDGVWEIYDEDADGFLAAIANRNKLDSFYAKAPSPIPRLHPNPPPIDKGRQVQLLFDKEQARAVFEVAPDEIDWVRHFMLDLNTHIRRISRVRKAGNAVGNILISLAAAAVRANIPTAFVVNSYAEITLKVKEPNATAKSIGDNLVSSAIFRVIEIFLAILFGGFVVWLYSRSGINIGNIFNVTVQAR